MPSDGVYAFSLSGAGSTRLYVGDKQLAANDNPLGVQEVGGLVALKAGPHPIRIQYLPHAAAKSLKLEYEGPGLSKRQVPAGAYHRTKEKTS